MQRRLLRFCAAMGMAALLPMGIGRLPADEPSRPVFAVADEPLTYAGHPLEYWSRIARRELDTKTREPAYAALAEFASRAESRDQAVAVLASAVETEVSPTLLESGYRTLSVTGTPAALQICLSALTGEREDRRHAMLTAIKSPGSVSKEGLEPFVPELTKLLEHPDSTYRGLAAQALASCVSPFIPSTSAEHRDPETAQRLTRVLTPAMTLLVQGLDQESPTDWLSSGRTLTKMADAGADLSSLRPALEARMRAQLLAFDPKTAVPQPDPREFASPDGRRGGFVAPSSRSSSTPTMVVFELLTTAAVLKRAGGDIAPAVEMLHRTEDQLPEGSTSRRSIVELIANLERGEFPMAPSSSRSSSSGFSRSFAPPSGFGGNVDDYVESLRQRGAPEQVIEAARQRFEERQREAADPNR